ncbi:hypothetical protein VTJ49DRAFT_5418 [Mycothermus thermophilus]|uniref:FAD/NAD(P)-binding domain-containing protein n=1 Tax=Humicola insolens TaxID=85995 RepID=A0ABR3V4M6_HUMIN
MVLEITRKASLLARLAAHGLRLACSSLRRVLSTQWASLTMRRPSVPTHPSEVKNVVVAGASFAGYFAARLLATSLPKDGRYRVVVIEPNSHFNFTWIMPRFCVVGGHEHKAFIPYTPAFFSQAPKGMVRWVQDRVTGVRKNAVVLRSGDEIPFEFLLIATGSTMANGLPSRVGVEDKAGGIERLKSMQARIREATRLVIAGGGAAGVELATDAKSQYPDKSVTLVHSRQAVMSRFGPGLQKSAMEALQKLGVDVVVGEKVQAPTADGKFITLSSGRQLECDCLINCTGQKPASGLVAEIAPHALAPSGRIRVKPTLQIDDDSLPNVFACGDVAETKVSNQNARTSARQAEVAADNIVQMARGRVPSYTYEPAWQDEVISLTLGLGQSITEIWDGRAELLFSRPEKDLAPMCERAWRSLACKPFEDTGVYSDHQM